MASQSTQATNPEKRSRPIEATALNREIDHQRGEHVARTRSVFLGLGDVERRLHPQEVDLEDGDHDGFLRLELVVDGGLRDSEGVGDHLQRRAADPVLAEQLGRGGDDAQLRGAAGGGSQSVGGDGCRGAHLVDRSRSHCRD